jgi:hypothetical protein
MNCITGNSGRLFVSDKASSVVALLRLGMKDTLCMSAYVPSCYSVYYCLCTKLQGYSSLNT